MKSVDYSANVGSTSTRMLERNINRFYVALVNDSDEEIYLSLGQTSVSNKGIRLNSGGGSYEINTMNPYNGYIEAICASGGKKLCVIEVSRDNI